MANILIADDSPSIAGLLKMMIESSSDLEVIGIAENGQAAVEKNVALEPDIITMDINMPVLGGLEALDKVMSTRPCPVIIISSGSEEKDDYQVESIKQRGAVAVLDKPPAIGSDAFSRYSEELIENIKKFSGC